MNASMLNKCNSFGDISQGSMLLYVCPAVPNPAAVCFWVFFPPYLHHISKLEQKHIYNSSVNRFVSKRAFNTVMVTKQNKKP